MTNKQKLVRIWIGKEHRPKLEPRILLEDSGEFSHALYCVTDSDIFDNRPIIGYNVSGDMI